MKRADPGPVVSHTLPGDAGYRIADVGPGGAVWLVGGSSEGRYFDRIHVVPPAIEVVEEG